MTVPSGHKTGRGHLSRLTVKLMETFGIHLDREGYKKFKVPGKQLYCAGKYVVETDCSQAAYFWGAAAINGAEINVAGIQSDSAQGDVRFVDLLQQMGCHVSRESNSIGVAGGRCMGSRLTWSICPTRCPHWPWSQHLLKAKP